MMSEKNRKIKILINALSAQKGGGQTYITNLLKYAGIHADDFDINIVCTETNENIFNDNISLIVSPFAGRNLVCRFIWENFYLPFFIIKNRINIYYSLSGILPKFFFPKECMKVVICQNMLPFCPSEIRELKSKKLKLKFFIIKCSQYLSFCRADLIIFISQFAREVILNLPILRLLEKEFVIVPHGISEEFRSNRMDLENHLEFDYVLYVSSFFEYKAHDLVVDSWLLFRKEMKSEYKLVFIGPEGSGCKKRIRDRIKKEKLENFIILLDEVKHSDLPAYYSHAKLLIFASRCENCPNILLEGLASGVPTLCSLFPPMPEFGRDSVVYFNPNEVSELASLLCIYLEDNNKRESLVRKSLVTSRDYSWGLVCEKTWKKLNTNWSKFRRVRN